MTQPQSTPGPSSPPAGPPNSNDHRAMNLSMAQRVDSSPAAAILEQGYALRVLHTTGRTSGQSRSTPLGVLQMHGDRYLVSPDGTRDWVQNLLAGPHCRVSAGGESGEFEAHPVGGSAGASVVRGYLDAVQVPWALRAFPVAKDATIPEIENAFAQMAVFRLDPIESA